MGSGEASKPMATDAPRDSPKEKAGQGNLPVMLDSLGFQFPVGGTRHLPLQELKWRMEPCFISFVVQSADMS